MKTILQTCSFIPILVVLGVSASITHPLKLTTSLIEYDYLPGFFIFDDEYNRTVSLFIPEVLPRP